MEILSPDQIVDAVTRMKPEQALRANGHGHSLCSTGVIEKIAVDGKTVNLELVDRKYVACYLRVSTTAQRSNRDAMGERMGGADGFSVDDQARRLIDDCVSKRLAFRIFSDAGFSGNLPNNDAAMINKAYAKKAETYRRSFDAVFLAPSKTEKLDAATIAAMQAYRDRAVNDIYRGRSVEGMPEDAESAGKFKYRPAFSILMEQLRNVHTISVTDWSRMSRNFALTIGLLDAIKAHGIKIHGVVDSLSFMAAGNQGDELVTLVYAWMAAARLQETTTNTMRGILQSLEDGFPHANIPQWMKRNEVTHKVEISESHRATILKMIELYLTPDSDGKDRGTHAVALELTRQGYANPTGRGHINREFVRHTLISPYLVGKQELFGREWNVLPAITDAATRERILDRMDERQESRNYQPPTATGGYIATGLFRCWCGSTLNHYLHDSGTHQYNCTAQETKRQSVKMVHAKFTQKTVDAFFDDLISAHSSVIVSRLTPSVQQGDLIAQINRAETELRSETRLLEEQRPIAMANARAEALKLGFKADSPGFDAIADGIATNGLDLHARRIDDLKAFIAEQQFSLKNSTSDKELGTMKERVEVWNTMTGNQKNALLRKLFKVFQCNETESETTITPTLNDVYETRLPPIRCKLTGVSARARTRSLPSVAEWLDSAIQPATK